MNTIFPEEIPYFGVLTMLVELVIQIPQQSFCLRAGY